jgi:hypothetical protein
VLFARPDHPLALAIASLPERPVAADEEAPAAVPVPPPFDWGFVSAFLGVVMAGVFVAIGLIVVVPAAGLFGYLWTGWAVVIGVLNARTILRRGVSGNRP